MAAPARWTIPHEDPILTSSDDPLVLPIRNYEAREQSVDHLLGHTSNDAEQILWESCGKWLYLACNHCQTNPWNICWNVWIWCSKKINSCQQHPEQWEGTRRVLHLGSSACLIQPICPLDKLSWQPGCQVLNINIQGRNFCISQGNGSSTNLPENLV